MFRFLSYCILILQISFTLSAQQIDKVIISGFGGQHDLDVKNAFMIGYSSYNEIQFTGEISLYSYGLQSSFEYAVANDYNLIIRSTTGLYQGIDFAPSYPSVELVMPAGSNSYIQTFFDDVINSPVVITGAGVDSNQTAYKVEFFSIDPIGENASSFSNGYIAGQLSFIANTLDCSFDSARTLARLTGTENGTLDFYNGFGKIQIDKIISGPLPVELSSFTAIVIAEGVKLNWMTETEVDNYGFEIQKSEVGSQNSEFVTIGFVEGYGNSNSPKEYTFIDESLVEGEYSYRLKQIDNNGEYEYSDIVELTIGQPIHFSLEQNYPNPFNPSTTIEFSSPETDFVTLKVFNLMGEEIKTLVNETVSAGIHTVEFNPGSLASGVYLYRLSADDFSQTRKMQFIK